MNFADNLCKDFLSKCNFSTKVVFFGDLSKIILRLSKKKKEGKVIEADSKIVNQALYEYLNKNFSGAVKIIDNFLAKEEKVDCDFSIWKAKALRIKGWALYRLGEKKTSKTGGYGKKEEYKQAIETFSEAIRITFLLDPEEREVIKEKISCLNGRALVCWFHGDKSPSYISIDMGIQVAKAAGIQEFLNSSENKKAFILKENQRYDEAIKLANKVALRALFSQNYLAAGDAFTIKGDSMLLAAMATEDLQKRCLMCIEVFGLYEAALLFYNLFEKGDYKKFGRSSYRIDDVVEGFTRCAEEIHRITSAP